MTGYKERHPLHRKRFLRLHERFARRGKTFVYIDESGFEPGVTRRYAYAPKGQRVYGWIAGRRKPRTSWIAARMGKAFEAPFLFDGPCTAEVFNRWLERQLGRLLNDNHVVVMDHAAFHKGKTTAELIHRTGAALLFLPPYAPDLNPIEHDFAAIKKTREYNEELSIDQIIKVYK